MTKYAIGLGSNLGDRLDNLRVAVHELGDRLEVVKTSPLYEALPYGGPAQGPYLNAVVVVVTEADVDDVLTLCHLIETAAGRVRAERWGPRTLDLDIIASDGPGTGQAIVPHPRAAEREFVLRPLCDVWPEALVGSGLDARSALSNVKRQGVDLLADHWVSTRRPRLDHWLVATQFLLIAAIAAAMFYDGRLIVGYAMLLGVLAAVVGAVISVGAARQLGPAMTAIPDPKPGSELVESGFYRWIRHPIYSGIVLFMVGAVTAVGSVSGLVGSILLFGFLLYKATYEERRLRMRHAGYRDYMERVPRRLIPYVL